MFYYASVRTDRALKLEPGQEILQGYLAADFTGSSDQLLMIDFQPPGCLRVLDADYDPVNPLLPPLMRDAAKRSNPAVIVPETSSIDPITHCRIRPSSAPNRRMAGVITLSKPACWPSRAPGRPLPIWATRPLPWGIIPMTRWNVLCSLKPTPEPGRWSGPGS